MRVESAAALAAALSCDSQLASLAFLQENTAAEKRRKLDEMLDAHPTWRARRRLPPASADPDRARDAALLCS